MEFQREAVTTINEANLTIEEETTVDSLFQPDMLLSSQYFETVRTRASLEPEKRLMLAVLEDAVLCFQKGSFAGDRRRKALFPDAEEWIMEENSDWPFSFENICEVLGFNPDYLRQGLLRWKGKKLPHCQKIRAAEIPSLGHWIPDFDNGSREGTVAREGKFL